MFGACLHVLCLLARRGEAWPEQRTFNEIRMCLTRWDAPKGNQNDGLREQATWVDGVDPVHWPRFTIRNNEWFKLGQPTPTPGPDNWHPVQHEFMDLQIPLWPTSSACNGAGNGPPTMNGIPFWQRNDWTTHRRRMLDVDPFVFPGNIRLRNILGQGGSCMTLSASRYISTEQLFFNIDVMSFPVVLNASKPNSISSVEVVYMNETVYELHEHNVTLPVNSLTLQLPASLAGINGSDWTMKVNGGAPVHFNTGLTSLTKTIPRPVDQLMLVNESFTVSGITFQLRSLSPADGLAAPYEHYAAKQWEEVRASIYNSSTVEPFAANYSSGPTRRLRRHLNAGVPRAPVGVHGISMPAGMSGAWFFHNGQDNGFNEMYNTTAKEWAAMLEGTFDFVAEQTTNALDESHNPGGVWDQWAQELADHGVGIGIMPNTEYQRPLIAPEIALYGATIPEYAQPQARDVARILARFSAYPNMKGMSMGADNAGYVQYWNWAQGNPNRPYGLALDSFMAWLAEQQGKVYSNDTSVTMIPVAPSIGTGFDSGEGIFRDGTTPEMIGFLHGFDQLYNGTYSVFAEAVVDMLGPEAIATTGSCGSSPGVGGNGGFPWATIACREMFAGMTTVQSYDWNENNSTLPMHNTALLDRLRSWWPEKKAFALVDNFGGHLGRQARLRAWAWALSRGPTSVGTNYGPHMPNRTDTYADLQEAADWVHTMSGSFAGASVSPSIAILYVNEQSNLRTIAGPGANDQTLLDGCHEGKTTEALIIAQAAGWPAALTTPDELIRLHSAGARLTAPVLLLVGLKQYTPDWSWISGNVAGDLLPVLKAFVAYGGKILVDRDSESSTASLTVVKTGMQVRAYTTESDDDQTGLLISRNLANVKMLQTALVGVTKPLAMSPAPNLWTTVTTNGNVSFVSAINMNNISTVRCDNPKTNDTCTDDVEPMPVARLMWSPTTKGPIYDMRQSKLITAAAASSFNLTSYPFNLFGLPGQPIQGILLKVVKGTGNAGASVTHDAHLSAVCGGASMDAPYYEAHITVLAGASHQESTAICGVPVEITVVGKTDSATVWASSCSGAVKLPLTDADSAGDYKIMVTDKMAGTTAAASVAIAAASLSELCKHVLLTELDDLRPKFTSAGVKVTTETVNCTIFRPNDVAAFGTPARNGPAGGRVVVALTPEQEQLPAVMTAAKSLVEALIKSGRTGVTLGTSVPPNASFPYGIIDGVQPYDLITRFPAWRSLQSDIIILGTAIDIKSPDPSGASPLLYDLAHSHTLPMRTVDIQPGNAFATVAKSAFLFGKWALVISSPSVGDLSAAMGMVGKMWA